MKKIIYLLCLFISLTSICFGGEQKKFVVLLDWFANPDHAPLFVAEQQGFFKEEGLNVDLIGPADPSDPPKLVAAGKADVAVTYEPQFIEQVNQGLPLIRIGTLIDRPLSCLSVLKEGPIKSIADLKSKRIGSSTGELGGAVLKSMLETHGIKLDEVERINVHYDLTQALLSKKVDAVTGLMRNYEIIQMQLAGHPVRTFFPEENGVPNYSELILVARPDHLNDPRLKHFLIALKKGEDYLQKHPQESWVDFAKSHKALNDELNKRAWFATLPYFAKNPEKFDAQSWLRFAQFMQKNGLISKVEPINTYAIDLI